MTQDNMTMTLRTHYPCCKGPARIVALLLVPREQHTRTCSRCGRVWDVERRTGPECVDRRIDILDWHVRSPHRHGKGASGKRQCNRR